MSLEENKPIVRKAIETMNRHNLSLLDDLVAPNYFEALKIKTLILILIAGILLTSSNSVTLANAQPISTSLTIALPSAPQGKECTLQATLKDENGNPVQNMDIDFYLCGTEKIGTVKTDSNGVASLKYTLSGLELERSLTFEAIKTGAYKFNAIFRGTTNYAQSSSENMYVGFIVIDYTPYIVVGIIAAAAIIGVVGYIVSRRRKTAIAIPKTAKED